MRLGPGSNHDLLVEDFFTSPVHQSTISNDLRALGEKKREVSSALATIDQKGILSQRARIGSRMRGIKIKKSQTLETGTNKMCRSSLG